MLSNIWSWLKAASIGVAVEVYHYLMSKIRRKNLVIRDHELQAQLKENEDEEQNRKNQRGADSAAHTIKSAIDRGRKL